MDENKLRLIIYEGQLECSCTWAAAGWRAGGRRAQTDIWPCCVRCLLRLEQKKNIPLDKIDSDIECECVGVIRLVSGRLSYILSDKGRDLSSNKTKKLSFFGVLFVQNM